MFSGGRYGMVPSPDATIELDARELLSGPSASFDSLRPETRARVQAELRRTPSPVPAPASEPSVAQGRGIPPGPSQALDSEHVLVRYQYDWLGRVSYKVGEEGTRQYVYDGGSNRVLLELDENGALVARYNWAGDRLVSVLRPERGTRYPVHDGLGSVVGLTSEDGATTAAYHLDAWGSPREPAEFAGDPNRYAFTGHRWEREIGMYRTPARYFDPGFGRFLTQDTYLGTVVAPPSLHRYLYANANPGRYTDPTGRFSWPAFKEGLANTLRAIAEPAFWVFDTALAIGGRAMDIPTEHLPLQSALAKRQLQRVEEGQSGASAALKGAIEALAAVFSFGTTAFAQGQYEAYRDFDSGRITLDEYDARLSEMAGGQAGAAFAGSTSSRALGRTWTGRAPANAPTAAVIVESPTQVPGGAEPAAPGTRLYHYTDHGGLKGIVESGKILASDPEVPWGVNPQGLSDAGLFNPARGMGTRSESPNVFFTDVPPHEMTPALRQDMGIRSTEGVVSMQASEAQSQGLPVYRNPHHSHIYNAVGDAVRLPAAPATGAGASAASAVAPKTPPPPDDVPRRPR